MLWRRSGPALLAVTVAVAALVVTSTASLGALEPLWASASASPPAVGDSPLPGPWPQGWSGVGLGTTWLTGVSFADARHGWVSSSGFPADSPSEDGVWHTADGGGSWRLQSTRDLRAVFFTGLRVGWGLGTSGGLYRTTDAGRTWIRKRLEREPRSLYQVRFTDARHGSIAAGQYGARHGGWVSTTVDGGRSWRSRRLTAAPIRTVFFLDGLRGWAAGDQDVLRTVDGGCSWTLQLHRGNGEVGATDMWFVDRRHGWIVGDSGSGVLATKDGGRTWRRVGLGRDTHIDAVRFRDARRGWAVGVRYPGEDPDGSASGRPLGIILTTTDGGTTWHEDIVPQVEGLFALELLDDGRMVAAGAGAVLLYAGPPR